MEQRTGREEGEALEEWKGTGGKRLEGTHAGREEKLQEKENKGEERNKGLGRRERGTYTEREQEGRGRQEEKERRGEKKGRERRKRQMWKEEEKVSALEVK